VRDNIARFGGSPRVIHLMGHSAGAYDAMMLTLDRRYLAAVRMSAGDIRSTVDLSGPYDFLPFDIDLTKEAFGNPSNPSLSSAPPSPWETTRKTLSQSDPVLRAQITQISRDAARRQWR